LSDFPAIPARAQGFAVDIGSPKLKAEDRRGVFGWLYYFAAFSPIFVRSVIRLMRLGKDSLILDPFVGSGTTCVIAKSLNVPSIGVELNPVAYFVSRAKLFWDLQKSSVIETLNELKNIPNQDIKPTLEFAKWFVERDVTLERSLSLGSYILSNVRKELVDFFISALLLSLRKVAISKHELNPTWIPQKHKLPKLEPNQFFEIFSSQTQRMLSDIEKLKSSCAESKSNSEILYSDALEFEYPKQFDAIITSPPYLSRLDYIVSFRLENEFLENIEAIRGLNVRELRDKMIGTVTITDKSPPNQEWGPTCLDILHRIRNHPSKAAATYYYPTIMKYFKDMYRWFIRSRKLLNPASPCVIVVQTSHFKEIEIPVSSIFVEMGRNAGFESASIIRRENVRFHRGLMDPEQRKYAPAKVLHEDIVLLR